MSESTNPLAPLIEDVCGPLYFAVVLLTGFYGVSCMQTFYYYVHYPNDSRLIKIFVAVMWALDTIHEALTVAGVYKYIMGGLANPISLLADIPEFILQGISAIVVALPTQAFFVYRIYVLSGKNLIAPLIWITPAIYQIVATIMYAAKAFYSSNGSVHVVSFIEISNHFFSSITISNLAVGAAIDALIAIAMIIMLFRQRTATGFVRTLHILQRLMIFAVNTGLWTAMFAVLSAILVHVYPTSALYTVFAIPLSSLYCNALLANLNGRTYIRRQGTNMKDRDETTANESARFSSAIHLDIRKTTESATFSDTTLSTKPNAENMT